MYIHIDVDQLSSGRSHGRLIVYFLLKPVEILNMLLLIYTLYLLQVTIADSGVNMGQSQPGFDVFPSSVTLTVSQAPLKCMHSVENKIVPMVMNY